MTLQIVHALRIGNLDGGSSFTFSATSTHTETSQIVPILKGANTILGISRALCKENVVRRIGR